MDRLRGLGIFSLGASKDWPRSPLFPFLQVSRHRWFLAGTSESSPSQRGRQTRTWEEVGGSQSWGRKPDVVRETSLVVATMCSGPRGGSSSAGCGLLSSSPGWSMGPRCNFPALFLGVSEQPRGKWVMAGTLLQKPRCSSRRRAERNLFFQAKTNRISPWPLVP